MTEERRRKGKVGGPRQKLAVRGTDPNFVYRWINDDGTRVQDITQDDDYDFVDAKNPADALDGRKGLGSAMCKIVGRKEDGSPLKAYLVRKRKDHYEEDRKAMQEEVDRREQSIRMAKETAAQDSQTAALAGHAYGEVTIGRKA